MLASNIPLFSYQLKVPFVKIPSSFKASEILFGERLKSVSKDNS